MTNVKTETKGDLLIITIDTSKATRDAAQPSASGKTKVIASTQGNQAVVTPAGLIRCPPRHSS